MDKMIIKDGTEIALEAGAALSDIRIVSENREAMLSVWDKFTPDNLKSVAIKNDAGLTVAEYKDLILESETSIVDVSSGAVSTSYHMRKKTDEEKRLDALEDGQAIQDLAISDLGNVTSQLAGGVQ